ncbi:CoA transferase [Phycicoccus endophyticus]|uniref:CoA transferase n=1 Tax=Phycicoccus endophyticus TaxID=1690220 RepID=A0A7G9R1Q1_9MICO|nr:CaiB/BaiF CoA-transferase family protein [Phycicoccus endophyticus]NHI18682.1 CoA transferase [Phycicoccus endophyticus]QNN49526.1 CoA transferase [Phycicoccus endophyticus]GGL37278.1 CoA transferase [Phycicoccus endophyticus]
MSGPLAGVRVVELAGIGPVPFAATYLAELGADVVRVDRPGEASPLALAGGMRRSRPSIAVDLKHPAGADVVHRLLAQADVLLEGNRPGVLERLGLDPVLLLERNPRLVVGRMTGWGQDGPWARRAGHDLTYAAVSGTLHALGARERPATPLPLVADFAGGAMYLVAGVLAALVGRASTGRGQVVDAAMSEGAAHLVTMVHEMLGAGDWRDERGVNLLDGGAPFYDVYECADGRFVAVGALEPGFWRELVDVLGVEVAGEQYDAATWDAQRAAFESAFAARTRDEWAAAFEGSDACVAPVLSLHEAPDHPQAVARGTFGAAGDPGAAPAVDGGHPVPRVVPRFSATPARPPGSAPAPGADTTRYLLAHGFTADEVAALIRSGAVRQP